MEDFNAAVYGEHSQSNSNREKNFHLEELTSEELESQVEAGLFYKVKDHKEHFAIHPYWITRPKEGVLEELSKTLGKWNSSLQAYVVGFEKVRSSTTSAAINEDHKWLHLDILVTFYLYKPEEGQRLRGTIKKIGNQASICIVFNVFSATVFAQNQDELNSWSLEDELYFEIYSFQNRRKGPIIRAKSIDSDNPVSQLKTKKSRKNKNVQNKSLIDESFESNPITYDEDWESVEIEELEKYVSGKKKKKKHKKV